ncbi:hypothetical protein BU16DRAFT_470648 [Lophium mytilinum]|uniref:Cytochrome P450 n=1 Tax=Lophium mytilinum TaxID=390894 RepID=A0A6A6QE96_9PEZI|nr:hypothetical protein BU16DRAFT_470648 [Lophium mytilinum]
MVSARSIFYGVNASNAIIKQGFIPSCWLLLTSPFILLIVRFLRVDISPLSIIPEAWRSLEFIPQAVFAFVVVGLSTRILSGRAPRSNEFARRVPAVPYWMPWTKNLEPYLLSDYGFLRSVRDSTIDGIFSYNLAGTVHHALLYQSLSKAVLSQSTSTSDAETDVWTISQNALAMPQSAKTQYLKARFALNNAFKTELVDQNNRQELTKESVSSLQYTLPDLTTFNSSIVDQMPWERVSDLDILEDMEDTVETNLMSLINESLSPAALNPITGSTFPESNQLLFVDLSTFSTYFYALATGLPRFFPLRGLTPAYLSRNRLLQALTIHHESLSSGSISTDADAEAPTPLSQLDAVMSTHDLPPPARAAATLGFLNQLVSSTIPLAFWTLLRIHAQESPTLLPELLAETKDYAKATQPPPIHPSFPSPTSLTFSTTLASKCPLLTSCVLETLRLYATPSSSKLVTKDLSISEEKEDAVAGGLPTTWLLKAGDIVEIGASAWLRNTDPRLHLDPKAWKPERFVNSSTTLDEAIESLVGEEEVLRWAVEIVMAFVAGFIQLWVLEPKGGKEKKWKLPGERAGSVMAVPRGDIRVRIRKREIKVTK